MKEDRPEGDHGKGYVWVLAEGAALDGVKSTTRYRKNGPASARKRCAPHDSYLDYAEPKRTRRSKKNFQTVHVRISTPTKEEMPAIEEHIIAPPSPAPSNSDTIPDSVPILTPDHENSFFDNATITTSLGVEDELVFGAPVMQPYEYQAVPFYSSFSFDHMRTKQYDEDSQNNQSLLVHQSDLCEWHE